MTIPQTSELVLAMCPFSRGLSFVLFEGPLSLIDWAVKDIHGENRAVVSLEITKALVERYQPDILVLHRTKPRKRVGSAGRIEQMIATYAAGQTVECCRYSREDIRTCFRGVGAITRYEIAQVIAAHLPALSHRLPPVKKLWQSEDRRMGLFDAASLAMTYYSNTSSETSKRE